MCFPVSNSDRFETNDMMERRTRHMPCFLCTTCCGALLAHSNPPPPCSLPLGAAVSQNCLLFLWSYSQAKLKTTFASFDADMDGQIDMSELRALLSRIGEMPSEKHLQVPWHRKNDRGQRQLNVSGMCALIIPVDEQTSKKPGALVALTMVM